MRFTAFLAAVLGMAAATTDAQAQLFRGRRAAQQQMMPMNQGPMYFSPGSYSPAMPMGYVQPFQGNMVVSGQTVMPFNQTVIPAGYFQPSIGMPTTPGTNPSTVTATYVQQYPGGPLVQVNPALYSMPATSSGTTSSGVVTAGGTSTDSGGIVRTAGTTDTKTTDTGTTTSGTTTTGPTVLSSFGQPYFPMQQGMVMPYGTTFGGFQPMYTSGYTPFGGPEYIPVQQTRRGLFGRMRR
jgi:hypothetical protein